MPQENMTWAETELALQKLLELFQPYHEIGDKHLTSQHRQEMTEIRRKCIDIGAIRYSMIKTQT